MGLTSGLAIGLIGRDKRGECCGRRISKELGDLFSHQQPSSPIPLTSLLLPIKISYLGNASDILIPILFTEPQILIQSKAHIIAIKSVRVDTQVKKVLLQSGRDCGFAGSGEPSEPECEAALLGVGFALSTGETFMPGDVAVGC